ncbi:MAG: glycosyltransferase family 4 protein [Bryobacteraceae bacterium]|jgi:glycosyltransferase involved in cell wall biosynthesis|nr:glycosyltransferase family 4 protein [Bryobacteraceae bacterium]
MRVLVCTTVMPFQRGGAEFLAEWLVRHLRARGHSVELLEFPFSPRPDQLLEQMLALRLVDLSPYGDRLIAIRPPSYLVRHPSKVVWFIHHHRAAYDLWNTEYGDLASTPEGLRYRDAVRQADRVALAEACKLYANSRVVARRLEVFNGVHAEVLYPPLGEPDRYSCIAYDDYLLYVSRLTPHKRQWLALEAMQHTRTPVRLVIAGPPDPGAEAYVWDLKARISANGLSGRVLLLDRYVPEEEKLNLLSRCLAALYFPHDEDSYGFFTLEAQHAQKAVLTTTDAGGTAELLLDGVNGRIVPPDPQELAQIMDELFLDRQAARRLGAAGPGRIRELGIHWQRVEEKLLS